ncbi:MAG TPA: acyl-CoA dehydrogenase family protein [Candidatus Binatia bacterium]
MRATTLSSKSVRCGLTVAKSRTPPAGWRKPPEKRKYAAAEAAAFSADAALKILGAYRYSTEFSAERYYRDAKSIRSSKARRISKS